MTDAELTPGQEADVRRLLAHARHEEPLPADVAARLDGVLAGLSGERPGDGDVVVPLATRRRRVGSLLVAAAAVVAIGIGLDQVVDTGGDAAEPQSGDVAAGSATEDRESAAPESTAAGGASAALPPAAAVLSEVPVVEVDPQRFTRDVRRARQVTSVQLSADRSKRGAAVRGSRAPWAGCTRPVLGPGRLVPVRYDGRAAVLAFRPPRGETQVADLVQCPDGAVLRSVTLPR